MPKTDTIRSIQVVFQEHRPVLVAVRRVTEEPDTDGDPIPPLDMAVTLDSLTDPGYSRAVGKFVDATIAAYQATLPEHVTVEVPPMALPTAEVTP